MKPFHILCVAIVVVVDAILSQLVGDVDCLLLYHYFFYSCMHACMHILLPFFLPFYLFISVLYHLYSINQSTNQSITQILLTVIPSIKYLFRVLCSRIFLL